MDRYLLNTSFGPGKYFDHPSDPRSWITLSASLLLFCSCPFSILIYFYLLRGPSVPKECRRIGMTNASNLDDQFHRKYTSSETSKTDPSQWQVKSIWAYPIKSCRGVEFQNSSMSVTGLKYDRQFMLVTVNPLWSKAKEDPASYEGQRIEEWKFMTQRENPLMSQIHTEIWEPDEQQYVSQDTRDAGGYLVVKYPVHYIFFTASFQKFLERIGGRRFESSFKVPLNPSARLIAKNGYDPIIAKIWKDFPEGLDMSRHLPVDFKKSFTKVTSPIKILRVICGKERQVFRCAPRKEQLGRQPITGFADANPVNFQNLASVRDVEARQPAGSPALSVLRFRPNIIITGPPCYSEDTFKRIRIGSLEYVVYSRCARCRLPNIDPNTGIQHKDQPHKTLLSFRQVDEGAKPAACLGMDMVAADLVGRISVGDKVVVLQTGEHLYKKQ